MSKVTFFSSQELQKVALNAAMKDGKKREGIPTPDGDPTVAYTYKDKVFIVNDVSGEQVKSYRLPNGLEEVEISAEVRAQHEQGVAELKRNHDAWTSYTAVVVDTSGSMRKGDFHGAQSRLKAVWESFANDYIYRRIQEGNCGMHDMVSIVSFSDGVVEVLRDEPTTWILYNRLCQIRNSGCPAPRGHGHFIPGLKRAEELLQAPSSNLACALNLIFLSDGRPSDHIELRTSTSDCFDCIENYVEKLASKYGRRLNFSSIGIGKEGSQFEMLRRMADAASDFGAHSRFRLPAMSCASLGSTLTESATALAKTQIEMLDEEGTKQRKMKPIQRESRKRAQEFPKTVSESDFAIYSTENVSREIFFQTEVQIKRRRRRWEGKFGTVKLQHAKAKYVAMKKKALGQGGERFAFQFYELAQDRRTIVGQRYVAKESCFILNNAEDESSRRTFVHKFCMTQQFTSRIAKEFNTELDSLGDFCRSIPRVKVLECSVYHLADPEQGRISVLVEPRLDHMKWTKWNSNTGYIVREKKDSFHDNPIVDIQSLLSNGLTTIQEDENSVSSDECQGIKDNELTLLGPREREHLSNSENSHASLRFTPSQVAQAFSHFSYVATGEKMLICDVQGVHDESSNQLLISDPAIHQYYHGRSQQRKNLYGRSDLGEKGMLKFERRHQCTDLCRLVTSRLRRPKYLFCSRKRSAMASGGEVHRKKPRHS
ncbi:myosin heavy chain kinase [Seminavis robusta]|uniref:Myosin heavy chain kinase n=1 Tax=Seminavis robusta TaxID=568900 RepID=A0A9N8HUZ7_9STRA|nr:myosin heavy chain kinase [Seminavis robusta]|eukprot:Sro1906_g304610.1 myosin heavy chain kinase (712) ;mRNA; r:6462-8776